MKEEVNLKIGKSIYPKNRLSYNEWCKMFKVSNRYEEKNQQAQIISKCYDYSKMKVEFKEKETV